MSRRTLTRAVLPTLSAAALCAAAVGVAYACPPSSPASGARPGAVASGNACSNPALDSNLNGWGALDGGSVSRQPVSDLAGAKYAFTTTNKYFYQPQVVLGAGQTWTFSAKDRLVGTAGSATMTVEWYTASGTFMSSTSGSAVALPASTATSGSWTTVALTATVPSGAGLAHVLQRGAYTTGSGRSLRATLCDYEQGTGGGGTGGGGTGGGGTGGGGTGSDSAATRYGWGTPNTGESDEYNGTAVDLSKWGLFGAGRGQYSGCSAGYSGHGQRCGSQTTEGNGLLTVTSTTNGVTGGLYSVHGGFKYGRVEVRERAYDTGSSGAQYHAVPLLFPESTDYTHAEIDFAERDVASPQTELFVHHDGTQSECSVTIDSTQFHNWAIDWQPNSVTWYVDGNKICTVNASINYFNASNGGAQMDMFPNTGTAMRAAKEEVDWIHMYPVSSTQFD